MQISTDLLRQFAAHLGWEERSRGTIEKYLRDLRRFASWLDGREVTKEGAAAWRDHLLDQGYAPATINAMVSAVNHFLKFTGQEACRVRFLRVQRRAFRAQDRELTREEYLRL